MLRTRVPLRRALAAVVTVGVLAAGGTLLSAGGAAAQTSTVDGVTTEAPEIAMVGGRQYVKRGEDVQSTSGISVFGSFTLKVERKTVFSEVRLALRSTSIPGDSYDTGRQYDVSVSGTKNFVAQRAVPDGDWSVAALWLKEGRWNSGPWSTFSVRNGTVSIGQPTATEPTPQTSPAPSPTASPTVAPTASPSASPTTSPTPTASPAPTASPTPTVAPTPTLAPTTAAPTTSPTSSLVRYGDFNDGGFSQWDLGGASVQPITGSVTADARAYEGSFAARASIPAGEGNKFARTLWGNSTGRSGALNYGEGKDYWYGMAVYLPTGFTAAMQSYFVPMRMDNYGVSNVSRTGLSMWKDGTFRLFRERDGVESQTNLLGSTTFRLSEGQWHWLEVHQKLSSTDGRALNELYVDGRLIGSSTARNYYGEPMAALRYGIVAVSSSSQTNALSLWYDRASLSTAQIGPHRG